MPEKIIGPNPFYIADFYCSEKKLVIELDGAFHENQVEYDNIRNHTMNAMGIAVLRIRNEDVDSNVVKVVEEIKKCVNSIKNSPPAPLSSRREGK